MKTTNSPVMYIGGNGLAKKITIISNTITTYSLVHIDDGYILIREQSIEKIFKKNKVTRYLRVYKIIGRVFHLCYN